MFTRSAGLRSVVTALLTVWMTAVSLGVWVQHAHAAAVSPHVHGWGWCPAGCSTFCPCDQTSPVHTHRHLLFCGIECPNEPPTNEDSPTPPAGVSVIGQACDLSTPFNVTDLGDAVTTAPAEPLSIGVAPPLGHTRDHSRHVPLSTFASRLVSGVLRS